MDKRRLLILASIMLLTIIGFVWLLNSGTDMPAVNKNSNNKEPYHASSKWKKEAQLGSKAPYGLYVFEELLIAEGNYTEFNEIFDASLFDSITKVDSSLLMFIGNEFVLTDEEVDQMLLSVSNGNELFLSASSVPEYLYKTLFNYVTPTFFYNDSVRVISKKDTNTLYNIYEKDTIAYKWKVLDKKYLNRNYKTITSIQSYPDYIDIKYGNGHIFYHTNPLVMYNFQLLRKDGFKNYKTIESQFSNNKIQWLSFADFSYVEEEPEAPEEAPSMLAFIFEHKQLKWAFVVALCGMVAFFFFRSKREKPLVIHQEEKDNANLSYVDTIAGIYYDQKNPSQILKLLRKNFYLAVQKHFFLDLAKREDDKKIISLKEKSGIEKEKIEKLLSILEEKGNIDFDYLQSANKLVRKFYLRSGIWKDEEKKFIDESYVTIHRNIMVPAFMILVSVILIITAFILLSFSVGYGILFWPLGIAGCVLGAKMIGKPLMRYNNNEMIFYKLFGTEVVFLKQDLLDIEVDNNVIRFMFKDEVTYNLNTQSISTKDKATLEQMVFSLNYKGNGRTNQ